MKLLIASNDGTVVDTISDLEKYDLTKPLAQFTLCKEINNSVRRYRRKPTRSMPVRHPRAVLYWLDERISSRTVTEPPLRWMASMSLLCLRSSSDSPSMAYTRRASPLNHCDIATPAAMLSSSTASGFVSERSRAPHRTKCTTSANRAVWAVPSPVVGSGVRLCRLRRPAPHG